MGVRLPLPDRDLEHVLDHTVGLWDDIRGERLFVTGGTGFFGGWILELLLHANRRLGLGVRAVVLTRNPDRFRDAVPHVTQDPAISLLAGDVRDVAAPAGEFSHVLHLATETRLDDDAAASFRTAVAGAERVCELAAGARTRRLLLASSGAVYGRQPADLAHLGEAYVGAPPPEDPSTSYGQGKRAAEFTCAAAASATLEVKIARGFAFVGPLLPLDANFAIGNFIRDALAGGPIRVSGDGTPRRSYLYAADLAVWLWTILVRGESCRPYNVGSDDDLSIAELARLVAEVVRPNTEVSVARPSDAQGAVSRYVPSIDRARAELGLDVRIRVSEGIGRTRDWYSTVPKQGGAIDPASVS